VTSQAGDPQSLMCCATTPWSPMASGGALVGPHGDFAWMCFPSWESPPVFGALLGGNGTYQVSPTETRRVWGGYYEDHGLIWRSRWVTSQATIECREAMARPTRPDRLVVLRRIHARRGIARVAVRLDLRAGFRHVRDDGSHAPGRSLDRTQRRHLPSLVRRRIGPPQRRPVRGDRDRRGPGARPGPGGVHNAVRAAAGCGSGAAVDGHRDRLAGAAYRLRQAVRRLRRRPHRPVLPQVPYAPHRHRRTAATARVPVIARSVLGSETARRCRTRQSLRHRLLA
jgi:Domain of unknown function (DUF5911)